jgi:integrase
MGVYQKRGFWYARLKDGHGKWIHKSLEGVETKTGARALLGELEATYRRQRLGLDPLPSDCTMTLEKACGAMLKSLAGRPSHDTVKTYLRCHVEGSPLGALILPGVTPQVVEAFLDAKAATLKPESLNYLRGCLSRAFNHARRVGLWEGENPIARVKPRHVPRRAPEYLRAEEVPAVLAHAREWRNLFAAAIFTGLRKGELLALRKQDVDIPARRIVVSRSWDRDVPKGGRVEAVPIAEELVAYLEAAIAASPSELVFPGPDGAMYRRDVPLQDALRRALGRADIATEFRHVCRKRGCGREEKAPDKAPRFCEGAPEKSHKKRKMWPKAIVRPIRFHDLRHTTASLLLQAGAPLQAAQRILRHSDPKLTAVTYGHLSHDYLKAEVDRLTFGLMEAPAAHAPEEAEATGTDGVSSPPSSPETESGTEVAGAAEKAERFPPFLVGASGVEPPTSTVSR